MVSDEEDEEERTVIRPDALDAAESNPSKAAIDEPGIEGISNVDMENAMYVAYYDAIRDRAREIGEEIQSEIQQYAQPENDQINVSPDPVSVRIIEMHTLTLTYFEGVAFQFLQWAMKVGHESESHLREHANTEFPKEEPPRQWDEKTQHDFHKRMTVRAYRKGLKHAGFFENDDPLPRVKSRRHEYVHNPEKALELRAGTDSHPASSLFGDAASSPFSEQDRPEQLKEENLDEVVSDVLLDCMAALDAIEEMVENHLPVNETIYKTVYEG